MISYVGEKHNFWNKHFINLNWFSNILSACVTLDLFSKSKVFPPTATAKNLQVSKETVASFYS